MQFRGPQLFKKKSGHYSRRIVPTCYIYAFMTKLAIVDGWFQFECNSNVFVDMTVPYGSHCIDMTASPAPIMGVTGSWLLCFAACDWMRALVHLHCEVMIITSTTKTWRSCRSLGVGLSCLWKKKCHQNTMLMTWEVCIFKDEDLKLSQIRFFLK